MDWFDPHHLYWIAPIAIFFIALILGEIAHNLNQGDKEK